MCFFVIVLSAVFCSSDHNHDFGLAWWWDLKSAHVSKLLMLSLGEDDLLSIVSWVVCSKVINHWCAQDYSSHIPELQAEHPGANGIHIPITTSVLHTYRSFLAMASKMSDSWEKKTICFLTPDRYVAGEESWVPSCQGIVRIRLLHKGREAAGWNELFLT